MKHNFRQISSLILTFVLLCSLLAGCSTAQNADNGIITLRVMVYDRGIHTDVRITDNEITRAVNECMAAYNIRIEYVPVDFYDSTAKVKQLMASGNAADIMICSDSTAVRNYYPEGYTHNLYNYVNKELTPNLWSYLGEDRIYTTVMSDNEMWALNSVRNNTGRNNLFIRKDWLDALHLTVPTTPDGLMRVLERFAGLPDSVTVGGHSVIPASFYADGSIGPLACAFLESICDQDAFQTRSSDINGAMVCTDEGYQNYLRYLNRLYNRNLLAPDFLVTDSNLSAVREYILDGRVGAFEAPVNANIDVGFGSLLQTLKTVCPEAEYVSIPPLKNEYDGESHCFTYNAGGDYIFVPLTCEHTSEAMLYLDWLASDEGRRICSSSEDFCNEYFILSADGCYDSEEDFVEGTIGSYAGYEKYLEENYRNACVSPRTRTGQYTYAMAFYGTLYEQTCRHYLPLLITSPEEDFDAILEEFIGQLIGAGIMSMFEEQRSVN